MSSSFATRTKWRQWIERISVSATGLVLDRFVFDELTSAIGSKKLSGGELHRWLAMTYGYNTAVGVRRLLDHDRRTYSLIVLLREMVESHTLLTRRSYVRRYHRGGRGVLPLSTAHRVFDDFAGLGQPCVPRRVIQGDLRKLERIARRMRPVVNKVIAHRDRRRGRLGVRTIDDLREAVTVIERMCIRYQLLLRQSAPSDLLPSTNRGDAQSDIYKLTH